MATQQSSLNYQASTSQAPLESLQAQSLANTGTHLLVITVKTFPRQNSQQIHQDIIKTKAISPLVYDTR